MMIKRNGILSVLLTGIIGSTFAQVSSTEKSFTLKGDLIGLNFGKIYIETRVPITKEIYIDSAIVRDGRFEFKHQLSQPMYVNLRPSDNSFFTQFWIVNKPMTITGIVGKEFNVEGSEVQDLMVEWNKEGRAITDRYNKLAEESTEAVRAGDTTRARTLNDEMVNLKEKDYADFSIKMIEKHPDNYFSLNEAYSASATGESNYEKLLRYYNPLSNRLKNEPMGRFIANRLEKLATLNIGKPLPLLVLNNGEGRSISTVNYRGKIMLLTFGMAKVPNYLTNISDREKLKNKFGKDKFVQIDVLFTDKIEDLKNRKEGGDVSWEFVSDLKGNTSPVVSNFAVKTVPQSYLVDGNGIILAKDLSIKDLEERLFELIK